MHIANHEANVEGCSNKYSKASIITAPKILPRMRPLAQKAHQNKSRSNVKLNNRLVLICSSCRKENGHPLSLSTPQINPAKLITTAVGGFFAKHYEKNACQIGSFFSMFFHCPGKGSHNLYETPSPTEVYEGQMCGKSMYGSRTYPGVIILPTPTPCIFVGKNH